MDQTRMSREAKVELVALALYCIVLIRMDKTNGLRTAAHLCRWYASKCRDLGNWAYGQSIYFDNAARELLAP
jgi:hypothetical protein